MNWFKEIKILLANILVELRNIHYHLDRMEAMYMTVNKIKEKKN